MAWVLTQNNFDLLLAQDLSDFAGTGISWSSNQFLFDTSWGDTHYLSYDITSSNWDHGGLLGLGDDDHTQYLLADGSRSMSGPLNIVSAGSPYLKVQDSTNVVQNYVQADDVGGLIGVYSYHPLRIYASNSVALYLTDGNTINVGSSGIVLDEDNMASDSATKLATQQSIKAYVDAAAAGVPVSQLKGAVEQRIKATWASATSFTISGGCYHHDGTTEQMVFWDSTFTISHPATSGWLFLYVDDSSIAAGGQGGATPLVSSNFIIVATKPTWSNTKGGWYSGNDRCIFATYANTTSSFYKFWHEGDTYSFDSRYQLTVSYDYDTTWVSTHTNAPQTGWYAINLVSRDTRVTHNAEVDLMMRVNGSSATYGRKIAYDRDHGSYVGSLMVNEYTVMAGDSTYQQIRAEVANTMTWTVDCMGYKLPSGM